jgi:hypothetical protein
MVPETLYTEMKRQALPQGNITLLSFGFDCH